MRSTASHRRTLAVSLATVLALFLQPYAAVSAPDAGGEQELVQLINEERHARGLPALTVVSGMRSVARRQSVRMADGGRLSHNPNLAADVGTPAAENVGYGPSVRAVHNRFMDSGAHRANLLSTTFNQVGVGVENRDGTVWVTVVLRQGQAQPPPRPARSAPPPRPPPPPPPTVPPCNQRDALTLRLAVLFARETGETLGEVLGTLDVCES